MRWCWLVVVAFVVGLAAVIPVHAESVPASDGAGASTQTSHLQTGDGWIVENPAGGIQDVYYDPNAGPWVKHLAPIPGGAIVGRVYTLTELLHVGGGPDGSAPAWTDYHEEIITPGWTWNPTGPNQEPTWGFTAQGWNGVWTYVIPLGNTKVDWQFQPPLPVCTNVTLTKYLTFNGGADPNAPVVVQQWPTVPEPATWLLLATGLFALAGFRWRRGRR